MLQMDEPQDYVLATGVACTVREFVASAFEHVGLDWERYVRFDERYLRPTEVDALMGRPTKARRDLGWQAATTVAELAKIMVDADIAELQHDGGHWIDTPKFLPYLAG